MTIRVPVLSRPAVIARASRRHRAVRSTSLTSLMLIGEAMRRRAWVWCAAGLAGLVISVGIYVIAPPTFQAQTSILVTNDVNSDPGVQIQGDIEIAQNAQVAEGAMDKIGSRQSVSAFLASYSVTAISDRVLQITARARSADAAEREADAIAAAFLKFRAYVLTTQQRLGVAALRPLIALDKRQFKALTQKLARVTAEPRSRARHAELRRLRRQYRKSSISLGALEYTLTNYPAVTQSMVQGSSILDAAASVPPSRRHVAVLFVIAGLICGLALGFGIVGVGALMSDRPRKRDDVARLLGSVVRSVGRPRPPAWRRRAEVRHLSDRLREAIPDRGRTALAVVAVNSVRLAATALAALAVSYAQDGRRVQLADLSGHASAARALGIREPGVHQVETSGAQLAVVVPEPGEVGPVGRPESVDLLLSLAELDPAVGADQLATWATDVAVVMTTGRSAPKTIHAVGEMVRLAGLHLAFGVLLHADYSDESLGLAPSRV